MYILSYKDGHDPAACLVKDGEIIAAAEEERFNRIKHAPSIFPVESIKFCLASAGVTERDVDHVVYSRLKPIRTFRNVLRYYASRPPQNAMELRYAASHMKVQLDGSIKELLGHAGYQRLRGHFPNLPRKIESFDHHLCHAASAFYFSPFEEALIITFDGKGEENSLTISSGKENTISRLERRGLFESLGILYSSATRYLGFTPNDGEYKVMGLAPYGKPMADFSDILRPDEKRGYVINSRFVLYPFALRCFEKKFGPARKKDEPVSEKHQNIAASLQKALEESALSVLRYAQKKFPSRNLCLAGGVALNVKMNKVIWESGLVERIFIQPASGDDGLVFGGAALLYRKLTGKRVKPLPNLYLGPEFGDEEIKKAIEKHGLAAEKLKDPAAKTAELVAEGKVVGWFQGRMEFGPRALGNRSILAHPGSADMRDRVNELIKFREEFRPFCPSVLEEYGKEYLRRYIHAPYMILSFSTKSPAIAGKIPAVVHVDGTVRPQTLTKKDNPLYYRLIKAFHEKTGIGAVLNTSMNVRGEPIVCTPEDAVNFFLKTHVDALVIGDYLLMREKQQKSVFETLSRDTLATEY